MKFITIFKAGLEAFNDSLRIEASPVHLVLIEPGELFSLTPMSSKQTGHYQAMKAQRNSHDKEDKNFPTVFIESLFLTCLIDAYEGRDIMSMDIANAFIQIGMPEKK